MKKSRVCVDVGCMLALAVSVVLIIYSAIKPDGMCFVFGAMLFACASFVNSLVILNEVNKNLDSINKRMEELSNILNQLKEDYRNAVLHTIQEEKEEGR